MTIKRQMFSGPAAMSAADPGDVVLAPTGVVGSETQSWVVPAGVYKVSILLVGRGGVSGAVRHARIFRGAAELLGTDAPLSGDVGGGNGGLPGAQIAGQRGGGGGGAAGYSGDGGKGGDGAPTTGDTYGRPGSAGAGGGGGGGVGQSYYYGGGRGGGVGLLGQGANGAGGLGTPGNGQPGSTATGPIVGGGDYGQPGGNLRWRNNIPVTPGETLTVQFYSRAAPSGGQGEACRIMWYGGRSYPSNAGEAQPNGQKVITGSNTTFTVPANVTSICAAAQQLNGASAPVTLVVGGTTVLRAQNGNRLGDGGGDGGQPGEQVANPGNFAGGGGGGGGYTGNGGTGANDYAPSPNLPDSTWGGSNGAPGTGGGGGGGASSSRRKDTGPVWGGQETYTTYPSGPGGGVGISGIGPNGPAGGIGSPDPINGNMGGGQAGQAGGALAWKNAIAVTPGQVLTVNAAGGRIRVIWGPGRSYPSSAGNV